MSTRVQDMPPPGGFQPINVSRVPIRSIIGGKTLILGHIIVSATSLYLYSQILRRVRREQIEYKSSTLAITPLLLAERDREYLKQLRRNRDEEARLMANVKGWEVGKYFSEPIYHTIPEDTLLEPIPQEYVAHISPKEMNRLYYFDQWDGLK